MKRFFIGLLAVITLGTSFVPLPAMAENTGDSLAGSEAREEARTKTKTALDKAQKELGELEEQYAEAEKTYQKNLEELEVIRRKLLQYQGAGELTPEQKKEKAEAEAKRTEINAKLGEREALYEKVLAARIAVDEAEEAYRRNLKYVVKFKEPLLEGDDFVSGNDGKQLVENYVSMIYRYGASIIGIFCVLVLVISGVQITVGGLNSEMVSQAKDRIYQALLSLILLFLSALILRTVNPNFFKPSEADIPHLESDAGLK